MVYFHVALSPAVCDQSVIQTKTFSAFVAFDSLFHYSSVLFHTETNCPEEEQSIDRDAAGVFS